MVILLLYLNYKCMFNSSRWSLKRLEGYWKLLIHCKYLHAIQVSGRWIKLWKKKLDQLFKLKENKSSYMLPFKKIKHIMYQLNSKKMVQFCYLRL